MPCVRKDLQQPVCLTIVYNLSTGSLISSSVKCGRCTRSTKYNSETKNLTIKVPLIVEGILTINDNFQASCVTANITLPKNNRQNK
ncbi:hypothetical protein BBD40_06820 [Paenibacillus ihbetae]|uniref:Uncharacterized protein n=1 Tax=Paenibacillus ihbetae TaxID=1870820 RepID=A0ABX3JVA3_9BACL|nr:hypothetical protein BBD40_06820 [Paenibacillus ihbetae]